MYDILYHHFVVRATKLERLESWLSRAYLARPLFIQSPWVGRISAKMPVRHFQIDPDFHKCVSVSAEGESVVLFSRPNSKILWRAAFHLSARTAALCIIFEHLYIFVPIVYIGYICTYCIHCMYLYILCILYTFVRIEAIHRGCWITLPLKLMYENNRCTWWWWWCI